MRGELDALLGDLAERGQREHLKSAAVGQHRTFPVHKLADTAHTMDQLVAGTNVQVVGIGQLDLAIQLTQLHGVDTALDGGASTYVHKHRGLNIAVYRMENAAAGASVRR